MARSLIPALLSNNWWNTWDCPHRLFDQHFGLGLTDDDFFPPTLYRGYIIRPRRHTSRHDSSSGVSEVINTADKFQVKADVSQFSPEDITVKTVGNCVVIHGKHEEKEDKHGFVSREFTRRYVLPKEVDPEAVTSSLSLDGVLTVEAPKKRQELPSSERMIPVIVQKSSSENEKKENDTSPQQ